MNGISKRALGARPGGFSLIEVLIAVVVLATGLLALTALQGALMRNSADAKARSQLAAYAQSLIEDARQQGYAAIPTGSNDDLLSTSTGNSLADAASAMGVSDLTETSTISEVVNGTSSYKTINLQLNWSDVTGAARNLRLSSVVSPLLLAQNNLNELEPPDPTGGFRPIVRRPSPVTEGMIPIAMGNGQDTAATNPKPELVGRNNDTLVSDTRFDLLTFNTADNVGGGGSGGSGFARFDKRIETAMVGCTCQMGLGGFPTGGNSPEINVLLREMAFRPSYWNGTRYSVPEGAGVPTRSPAEVSQSELCDVCCRDHQDPNTATGPRFNPWSSTHDHYLDPAGTAVASGTFREACRVVRVDGVWRVTPDPKVQDVALLPTQVYPSTTGSTTAPADNNAATSPLVSTDGKTGYVAYAYDFIKQFFYDKTSLAATDRMAMQGTAGINNPEYVPINSGETRWLHARAILTDFLESDAIARIDDAIEECTGSSTVLQAQCVLPYVPLATVNATELAEWSGQETSQTGIVHTGPLLLAIKNYGQALLNRFVSGLALVGPINPADDDDPVKDEQTFAFSGSESPTDPGWLDMPNTSGTVFGDATNPVRGFATMGGATSIDFQVTLNNMDKTTASSKPVVEVGTSGSNPCGENRANNANPYACTTSSATGITLALGEYNYQSVGTGSNARVCGETKNRKQDECVTYTFDRATVDGAAQAVTFAVQSGAGTTDEVATVGNFTVRTPSTSGYPSAIQLYFNETTVNASAVCDATTGFVRWTCPPAP